MYSTDFGSEKKVEEPNKFERDYLWNFQGFHRFSFSKIRINRETRKNMHGGQIFFCRVGLLYIYQNLARDVNFQDSLKKFQYLSCT